MKEVFNLAEDRFSVMAKIHDLTADKASIELMITEKLIKREAYGYFNVNWRKLHNEMYPQKGR